MVKLLDDGVLLTQNAEIVNNCEVDIEKAKENSMAYQILKNHNINENMQQLKLKFDALTSPDNNYVSILQTVNACGLKEFPVPYVLSNCHNTLCAVGGTINEDDHMFGLDNAKKYGGVFIPPYKAVIHQYMREMMAGCGKMILGSDSHTRYGALGTLGVGEGGGEIAKQLLGQTYDIETPQIIAVRLTGKPKNGVGPMDVALAIIGATFKNGFTKNKILEFVGEGILNLSAEYRCGIDVMMTESAALSSIWWTDDKVQKFLKLYGREDEYYELRPLGVTYYDGMIDINLSEIECMMALPYHPSNVITIREFNENPEKYLKEIELEGQKIKGNDKGTFSIMSKLIDGKLHIDQALVSGCSGGLFENIAAMADILQDAVIKGDGPALGINPASQPIVKELSNKVVTNTLIEAGATIRPCICGPCFGVMDVPANNQLSIRHVTRNYPNREGSKPGNGQMAASFLMDARSIAATIRNNGYIAAATDFEVNYSEYDFEYSNNFYENQVFNNYQQADASVDIRKGVNIEDWPTFEKMNKHLVLEVVGAYNDSVTTDDLSPSGDAVAFRSNPTKLAEFTMINKDVNYVKKAKAVLIEENSRAKGEALTSNWENQINEICTMLDCDREDITIGSVIAGPNIGDGSSREQAASSQKILGGYADIACEFATKRYRSNLINWGLLPIVSSQAEDLQEGQLLLIRDVENVILNAGEPIEIEILGTDNCIQGNIGTLTSEEKQIMLEGCLINYNKKLLVEIEQ